MTHRGHADLLFNGICLCASCIRPAALYEIRKHFIRTDAQDTAQAGKLIVRDHTRIMLYLAYHLLVKIHAKGLQACGKIALCHSASRPKKAHILRYNVLIVIEHYFLQSRSPRLYSVFYLTLAYILS